MQRWDLTLHVLAMVETRCEVSPYPKFERTLAMLLKFQDLRRASPSLPGPIDPEPA